VTVSEPKRLAPLGVLGPLVFLVGVILVSWSERDFMAELGWDQWPSGTALGPHGWATVLVFLLTGACQITFGWVDAGKVGIGGCRPQETQSWRKVLLTRSGVRHRALPTGSLG
jgi:hypothetical protein